MSTPSRSKNIAGLGDENLSSAKRHLSRGLLSLTIPMRSLSEAHYLSDLGGVGIETRMEFRVVVLDRRCWVLQAIAR